MRISDWSSDVCSSDLLLLFEVTAAIGSVKPRLGVSGWLARRIESNNYAKYLFHRGLLQLERGARAEHDSKTALTALWRNRKAVLGLVGGRCAKTGTVQFPKSEVSVNANDHTNSEERRVGKEWVSKCKARGAPYN